MPCIGPAFMPIWKRTLTMVEQSITPIPTRLHLELVFIIISLAEFDVILDSFYIIIIPAIGLELFKHFTPKSLTLHLMDFHQ